MLKRFNKVEQATILVGIYVAIQMMADIAATKAIAIGPFVMDAGFIYSLTFTWRDLIHKRLGARVARLSIILAGFINVVMAAYFYLVVQLPPEPEWALIGGQEAWGFIFGIVPRIVVASIIAEVLSELVDTEVYEFWVRRRLALPQWTRVAVSNSISIPLDSAIFVAAAFGGLLPFGVLFNMFVSNIVVKVVFTILSFWMIYLVREGDEPLDKEFPGAPGDIPSK